MASLVHAETNTTIDGYQVNANYNTTLYFAAGVGLVAIEEEGILYRLTDYHIAEKPVTTPPPAVDTNTPDESSSDSGGGSGSLSWLLLLCATVFIRRKVQAV
ncbi:hypothetical protein [Rheinheimera faecalis]|uniref:hypothetical protein n=1 Tax=Rheinheimera faecalis TaxID=2901141 RepID=UPI001E539FA3|nr:hypothetical protein [Rheinheimera faecalis]